MTFSRDALSQTGTRTLALALLALLGCAQDDTGTGDPQLIVGDKDAEVEMPKDDASTVDACKSESAAIEAFVSTHDTCLTNSDCVIVGDCSHANFQSVAKGAADEARALVLGGACRVFDGPTYNAVCRANRCERVLSGESCGQAPQTACADGTRWQEPASALAPSELAIAPGCYASCTDQDPACPAGYTCQTANVKLCPRDPATNSACAGTGDTQHPLCLPAPDCEVELGVTFHGTRTVAKVPEGGGVEMSLWLRNRTTRALALTFDEPCAGQRVQGLSTYDPWQSCFAGACPTDPVSASVALGASENLRWRSAVLTDGPTACNATGLADGRLALSFALANVQGAKVCGPAAATLISGPTN